ncbi:hypothetical protein L2E82_17957 [Cichorium intybus]|uniref:Uncharacterized protein n=1 Tax=Cichorium intybus TaxID=13427 RepID=A0ACB9F8H2_CICIN|nr:hypothetical protein L2E82_17957 [Cichorium intybus]
MVNTRLLTSFLHRLRLAFSVSRGTSVPPTGPPFHLHRVAFPSLLSLFTATSAPSTGPPLHLHPLEFPSVNFDISGSKTNRVREDAVRAQFVFCDGDLRRPEIDSSRFVVRRVPGGGFQFSDCAVAICISHQRLYLYQPYCTIRHNEYASCG